MGVLAEAVIAAFDSNAQIVWTTEGPSTVIASFRVSSYAVKTTFTRVSGEEWQVASEVAAGQHTATEIAQASIRIFGGVFQAVREFLEVRQPLRLVFASKDEALGRLYESYLERQDTVLAQMGYEMIAPVRAAPLVEFTIRKKTPSEWRE